MNNNEYEILQLIKNQRIENQRTLAKMSNFSLGKVNRLINKLIIEGFLTSDLSITSAGKRLFEEHKVNNAIILAAGYGMRMTPINNDVPKALLQVKGEVLIERIIQQLHDKQIYDINIVVGFMKEKFEYLIDKFGVNLIVNPEYDRKNNLSSLYLTNSRISNTYIIPGDIWFKINPFRINEFYSWYMVSDELKNNQYYKASKTGKLLLTKNNELGNKAIGVAFISNKDSDIIQNNIKKLNGNARNISEFWEKSLLQKNKLLVAARIYPNNEFSEINTYEQLLELDRDSDHLDNKAIEIIQSTFSVDKDEIHNIKTLKKGMTNRSFIFSCKNKRYIMRIPGEGTDELINREHEYEVYKTIKDYHVGEEILYFNKENGFKITRFIDNARNCDAQNWDEVKKCMQFLKKFHNLKLKVSHEFNLMEQVNFYEGLRKSNSMYDDYDSTKKNIIELYRFINECKPEHCLTHIDANPDNFIIKSDNKILLIDWEYAGMQDPHLDIAMFGIYSLYDGDEMDKLIDIYFDGKCDLKDRAKIYSYIAISGLLWSNWCEYKRELGVDFGEYSLRQYRYAKDYYRKAKLLMGEINNE